MLPRGTDMRIESIYLRGIGPFDKPVTINLPEGTDPNLADVYLLTGPNGCGKSTVLYTLAALIGAGSKDLGRDLLAPRWNSDQSMAAVQWDGARRVAFSREHAPFAQDPILDPFDGGPLPFPAGHRSPITYFDTKLHFRYHADAEFAWPGRQPRFKWAAFAYSGSRTISDARVDAIQEPNTNPFEHSLDFEVSTNSKLLVHWVANQKFRLLRAKDAGNLERAHQIAGSIHNIEEVISQITGDDFLFEMNEDDNDIRVRRNGELLNMGVLPTGLQSIMSWVADLLMRLDRIPWTDKTPPMQRSFLLLLDEIDIHLHPAWQRKVLPVAQKLFPNAQIIASTHSPFVVASAEDAHVVHFAVENGKSRLVEVHESQRGTSYSAILKDIFEISSGFDVKTEEMFAKFHEAKNRLLRGETADRVEVERLARELAERSYEISQMIGFELRQLDHQLAQRSAGA
jgi:energy-coupling factor transporter ATP-binding protein EcfA2